MGNTQSISRDVTPLIKPMANDGKVLESAESGGCLDLLFNRLASSTAMTLQVEESDECLPVAHTHFS
jgi:hypothetical protein